MTKCQSFGAGILFVDRKPFPNDVISGRIGNLN